MLQVLSWSKGGPFYFFFNQNNSITVTDGRWHSWRSPSGLNTMTPFSLKGILFSYVMVCAGTLFDSNVGQSHENIMGPINVEKKAIIKVLRTKRKWSLLYQICYYGARMVKGKCLSNINKNLKVASNIK